MQHSDFRDGYLFVIRDKVSGDSDMGFIKIALTPELEALRRRALLLDTLPSTNCPRPICEQAIELAEKGLSNAEIAERLNSTGKRIGQLIWWQKKRRQQAHNVALASPFLIHRRPDRRNRKQQEGKIHWTYVNPAYLTKAFAAARDASGYYAHLKPEERPTFHEIRGLGSRLYEGHGISKKAIQALMTHSNKKTTEIYTEGGKEALKDSHFVPVQAPLTLREMLG